MKLHLRLIAIIGTLVPRRLRADWREEWKAELETRERTLTDWDRLDWRQKWDLLRRSTSAFWDALWLQRRRLEDETVQDLRSAVRILLKSPSFTLVAVATLALGIGANTAIFTFVNALLLRPLGGVTEPNRLVHIGRQYPDKTYLSDSNYADYLDYRAQSRTLSGIAAVAPTAFDVSNGQQTERVDGELVTGDYFAVLGVAPALGRLISAVDERNGGADRVTVISFRFWQRRFGGDPRAIGTTITLDGRDFDVIGVASDRFEGIKIGTPHDIWIPILTLRETDPTLGRRFEDHRPSWLELFGRLKPGVTLEHARTEMGAITEAVKHASGQATARFAGAVEPGLGRDGDVQRQLRRFAYAPVTAVIIVLLIVCANVAGLLLARSVARQKEIATRLALGASRLRIVRQLVIESLTLSVAGGAAGLALGVWLTRWMRSLLPERYLFLSFDVDFGVDWRVFTFMLAVAVATGLLFGLIPALQTSRPDLVPTLKNAGLPFRSGSRPGVSEGLIVLQVALSLVLLIASGLCVRSLHNAASIDTGYQVDGVLTARIDLAKQDYTEARGRLFQQQLIERLQAIPGIDAAGYAVTLPLNDGRWENPIYREDSRARVQTFQNIVSSRYLDALRIPLLAGRQFSEHDDERSPRVAIVNQTLAHRVWGNEDPLGRRFIFKGAAIAVIGVVRDIKGRNLFETPGPMLYLPLTQDYQPSTVLHVRATVAASQLIPALRREVQRLDPNLPVYAIKSLGEHFTATLTPQRLLAYVITGFGLLAFVLANIGLYGLIAYTVTERTPEIGIRVALGAQRGDVLGLFVAYGMRLAWAGAGLGLIAALGLTRLMKSLLFGVSPIDPLTFTMLPLALSVAALTACYMPARRAAAADPNVALRYE